MNSSNVRIVRDSVLDLFPIIARYPIPCHDVHDVKLAYLLNQPFVSLFARQLVYICVPSFLVGS
jgi:hypothetical protein